MQNKNPHPTGTNASPGECEKIIEPGHEKTCLMSYANNKGADQPAHPRSLISAFVVRCLNSVMSLVSVTEISSLMLASVAEQTSLSLTSRKLPKTRFLMTRLNSYHCIERILAFQWQTY